MAGEAGMVQSSGVLRDPAEQVPGSNRARDLAAADWRYLLPRLRFDRILHVGIPADTELPVLSAMGIHTVALAGDATESALLQRALTERGIQNIEVTDSTQSLEALPGFAHRFDLIVAKASAELERLLGGAWVPWLDSLLTSDGLAYIETRELSDALRLRFRRPPFEQHGFVTPTTLWLARRKGALRLAVSLDARAARRYLLDTVVAAVSERGRALRNVARALTRVGLLEYAVPGRALLVERRNGAARCNSMAAYVLAAVRDVGVRLAEPRLAFYARGDHNSNKVTFMLFDGERPVIIVKLPRAPLYNARLEHEHQTLVRLATARLAPRGSYPEALFLRGHGELAMAGQTVVTGTAFRNAVTGNADDAAFRAAIEWITALGEASANTQSATALRGCALAECQRGFDAAALLHARLDQLFVTYPLISQERAFLRGQADRLAGCALPAVFQHGDPGTWNIVVEQRTHVKFLDWEDSDPYGMPLWDLFILLASYAMWVGRLRGASDDASAIAGALFEPTPYQRQLLAATNAYCARVGVDRAAVEPLFYGCWVDRAVRIAPWISGPVEQSKFFRLLRRAIQQRHRPGLSCLFE